MIYTKFSERLKKVVRWVLLVLTICASISIMVIATSSSDYSVDNVPDDLMPLQETTVETVALLDEPITFPEFTYQPWFDIERSNIYIDEVMTVIGEAEAAVASNMYTDEAVGIMNMEITRLYSVISYTDADIRHYAAQEQEYYYAAKTWQFLRQHGFNDAVACAIIGNMMIETSGGTLALKPEIYSSGRGFYGLCQWSLYYKPFMAGKSFEEQLEYLVEDMPKEFENFGFCYKSNFTYEDFLAMEDPAQAAVAFAKVYERCGSGTYSVRKRAAITAFDYFTKGIPINDESLGE